MELELEAFNFHNPLFEVKYCTGVKIYWYIWSLHLWEIDRCLDRSKLHLTMHLFKALIQVQSQILTKVRPHQLTGSSPYPCQIVLCTFLPCLQTSLSALPEKNKARYTLRFTLQLIMLILANVWKWLSRLTYVTDPGYPLFKAAIHEERTISINNKSRMLYCSLWKLHIQISSSIISMMLQ